jgi:hypothetical protein
MAQYLPTPNVGMPSYAPAEDRLLEGSLITSREVEGPRGVEVLRGGPRLYGVEGLLGKVPDSAACSCDGVATSRIRFTRSSACCSGGRVEDAGPVKGEAAMVGCEYRGKRCSFETLSERETTDARAEGSRRET